MADIPKQIEQNLQARRDYRRKVEMEALGENYSVEGWGSRGVPKVNLPINEDGKKKYLAALQSIQNETKSWQDRIEELNPALEKEESEILKLTNDAENLIEKIKQQGAKGGVDVTGYVAQIRTQLEQGIVYIQQKKMKKLYEDYQKMVFDEVEYGMTENERAANQIIHKEEEKQQKLAELWAKGAITDQEFYDLEEKIHANAKAALLDKETENAKKIADTNYSLIQGIAGMQDWAYQLRIKQIDAEADKYEKDGADKRAIEAWKEYQAQLAVIQRSINSTTSTFWEGMSAAVKQYYLQMKTESQYGAQVLDGTVSSMKSDLGSLFDDMTSGDLDIKNWFIDFTQNLASTWNNMLAEMLTNWILFSEMVKSSSSSSSSGGLAGWFSSLFNSSSGHETALVHTLVAHGGGIIGSDSFSSRDVPASVFKNAPRFHKGNEYAAILERDEGVFTKDQMKAMGGSGGMINIININAIDSQSFADAVKRNPAAIASVVNDGLKNNAYGLRSTIKRTR